VNCSTVTIASCAGEIPGAPRVPYVPPNASSWHQAPSSSRARIASDPFRNARFAIFAVLAGTAGHGCGCIDMMTRFCDREQEQGKDTGRNPDDHPHHARRLVQQPTLPNKPTESFRGPSSSHIEPREASICHRSTALVRLGPRSYARWAALLWTCLTAPRIIGVARWIDRLTRCPGP
jgi:hypothetical protein